MRTLVGCPEIWIFFGISLFWAFWALLSGPKSDSLLWEIQTLLWVICCGGQQSQVIFKEQAFYLLTVEINATM